MYITKIEYDDGNIYTLSNYQPHIDWHIATMKLNGINVVRIFHEEVEQQ